MADQYYYELLGQEFGPISLSALQVLVRGGQLGTDARVRLGDAGPWAPASSFSELSGGAASDSADGSALEEISDLSEINADFSGDSHVLTSDAAAAAVGGSGSRLSKSTIEIDEEKSWYCQVLGEELGPMKISDLKHMVAQQELGPADLVRAEDQSSWGPAGMQLGELFPDTSLNDLLAAAPDSTTEQSPAASPNTPADLPSIDDFELSDSAVPASRSTAATDSGAGDFELADNVPLMDSAEASPSPPASPPSEETASEPTSVASTQDDPYQGLDDDDDQYQGLDDSDDGESTDWEAMLSDPAPSSRVRPAPAKTRPSAPDSEPVAATRRDSEGHSAVDDLINKASAAMREDVDDTQQPASKRNRSLSLPALPIEGLLKLVGVVALCAAGYFIYINLPHSTDVPTTYSRLSTIYTEFNQLPASGPDRAEFIEDVSGEIAAMRAPLNNTPTADKSASLDLNFAAGALLYLVNATEADQIADGKQTFLAEMQSCKSAWQSEGGDTTTMPDITE